MPSRKRAADEMETEAAVEEPSTLQRLRNMWEFANLAQYISLFGDAVKIDKDLDIEELESECLKPQPSEKLAQIGLALLKHVSSHKGLTLEIFDEYTRRQYVAKAPDRNPFGTEEEPAKFHDLDVFTKIRVLQQLSVWTLNNPNSIRERMAATDSEQTLWRMEPTGWDSQERSLFVLDDNRMYRLTDPPPPPEPAKAKSKPKPKKSKGSRSSKRQKVSTPELEGPVGEEYATAEQETQEADSGLGGKKWECICVTLEDYQEYMNNIRKSRDPNEKVLLKRLQEDVIPVLQSQAEEQARKQARKMKELENMQKLAMAKRSSRISSRLEKQKEVEEAEAAERRRQEELAMAKAVQEKQKKLEEAHDSRRMTREQRLKERETAKILKEEELRRLQENEQKLASNNARLSERHLKAMMKKHESDLKRLNEEEDWFFDCEKCGTYGSNLNDNTPQISCEKCNVWQHMKCHDITEEQADDSKFVFVCTSCKRKEAEEDQPKPPSLKLRITSQSPSSNSQVQQNGAEPSVPARRPEQVHIPAYQPSTHSAQPWVDGPSLSPRGQALGPPGIQRSEAAYGSPTKGANGVNGSMSSPIRTRTLSPSQNPRNNYPTSSPPPYNLERIPSSPTKSFHMPQPQHNGSSFGGPNPFSSNFVPSQPAPYSQSFSRPASAAGPGGSPVKHSPAASPRLVHGLPPSFNFNSPHSSFPPSSAHRPSFSPTKHSSPAPMPAHMSSPAPAPAPMRIVPSPSAQMPARMLPDPIPAPSKHDGMRPVSSHQMSETPIFPPVKSLEPLSSPTILDPPIKKSSPRPDKFHSLTNGTNGVENSSSNQ
ncbi:PHD multi-domain protein [Pyrenophora teres f. maculata]|nr:PHD multi-domain protein [Pyrenophora teres f. maculata]